jgi:hypothetical protein
MKILTLSTYPIAFPRHGGQHRLHNIVSVYRAAGHQTRSIGVLGSPTYGSEEGFMDCPSRSELSAYMGDPTCMEDWAIGQLASKDADTFESLRSRITETPDVIHVEQPWLFAFARRYASESKGKRVKLIYGAANIEHSLKAKILEKPFGRRRAEECARVVRECESKAAREADLICATSNADADWLRTNLKCEVIVAANGVTDRRITASGVSEANKITGHRKMALYCASGHPPNIDGFFQMFGRGIGCFSPDERLVVAGGAGPSIMGDARFGRTPGVGKHYVHSGEVSEECLAGLLQIAHVILLPITAGGGTNLKTAEALWSGQHVVATSVALRGFEHYCSAKGVSICDEPTTFRHAIREAMMQLPLDLSSEERSHRKSLLWESTLAPLVDRAASMGAGQ